MAEPIPPHTALTAAMHYADRIIDPWHEGYAESTERLALTRLAAAARVWLDADGITASNALTTALAGADTATPEEPMTQPLSSEREHEIRALDSLDLIRDNDEHTAASTVIAAADLYKHFAAREIATGRTVWIVGGDSRYARIGDGPWDYQPSPEGDLLLVASAVEGHPWGRTMGLCEIEALPSGRGLYGSHALSDLQLRNSYDGSWRQWSDRRSPGAAWQSRFQHTEAWALTVARAEAPNVTVNGITPAHAVARSKEQQT